MKTTPAARNKIFFVGLVVLAISSLVNGYFFVSVLFLFGLMLVPIVIGLLLIWVSRESVKRKLLASFVSVPAALIGLVLFWWSLPRAEPETFLIPSDLRGPFVVRFIEGCGDPITYEAGRRMYRISDTGALVVSGKPTFGLLDRQFLMVSSDGMKTELPEFKYAFVDESSSLRWKLSRVQVTNKTLGVFWGYSNELAFFVSDHETMEKLSSAERQAAVSSIIKATDADAQRRGCRP